MNVAYIGFGSFSRSMYRYHNNTISATLVHSDDDYNIKWSVTKNGSAITNKKIYNSSGYKKLSFFADKPKTVTFTAKYYYNGSKYISRKVSVKIKPIKIIASNISVKVGTSKKLNAKVQTLPKAKVTYSIPKQNTIKLNNGKVTAKNLGKVKVAAKYRALKKTFYVTVNPLLIFQTEKLPMYEKNDKTIAEDYDRGDKARNDLKGTKNITTSDINRSVKEHDRYFKLLCNNASSGVLTTVALTMEERFMNGIGGKFYNSTLTNKVKWHKKTSKYVNYTTKAFREQLQEFNWNIYKFKYTKQNRLSYRYVQRLSDLYDEKIYEPAFDSNADLFSGLKVTIDSFWGHKIEIVSYKKQSDGKYKVTLKYTFYDHYGLDKEDIEKFGGKKILSAGKGFKAWYILQHYDKYKSKYKPFVTYIEFTQETIVKNVKEQK